MKLKLPLKYDEKDDIIYYITAGDQAEWWLFLWLL